MPAGQRVVPQILESPQRHGDVMSAAMNDMQPMFILLLFAALRSTARTPWPCCPPSVDAITSPITGPWTSTPVILLECVRWERRCASAACFGCACANTACPFRGNGEYSSRSCVHKYTGQRGNPATDSCYAPVFVMAHAATRKAAVRRRNPRRAPRTQLCPRELAPAAT